MDSESVSVFLPSRKDCYERLRRARFGATVACVHCESDEVIKKGTTGKDAQQYYCNTCETYFNDLTGTLFEHHKFPIEELFYMLKEMRSVPTTQIARDLDCDYEAVLNFVHEIQDRCNDVADLTLSDVCEADEIYVTVGEKGIEQESPRGAGCQKGTWNLSTRQTAGRDTRPSLRRTSSLSGLGESPERRRRHRRIRRRERDSVY